MKPINSDNHDYTSLRIKKQALKRLRLYGQCGDKMEDIIDSLMDDHDKNHQPKLRNYKGRFLKKE